MHPVHVPGEGVLLDPIVAGVRVRHHQYELDGLLDGHLADAADDAREERVVGEDPGGGLGEDERDRLGPLGDQAAGGGVGHVAGSRTPRP